MRDSSCPFPANNRHAGPLLALGLWLCHLPVPGPCAAEDATLRELVSQGAFREAERLLTDRIPDVTAPVTHPAAIQLEILRRTRHDFSRTEADVLAEIRESVPDTTTNDLQRWRQAGDLQYRVIDGEIRYFDEWEWKIDVDTETR